MKITEIKVDIVPSQCNLGCIFYRLMREDIAEPSGWGWDMRECKLKIMMGYDPFGIILRPCPLDGKEKDG